MRHLRPLVNTRIVAFCVKHGSVMFGGRLASRVVQVLSLPDSLGAQLKGMGARGHVFTMVHMVGVLSCLKMKLLIPLFRYVCLLRKRSLKMCEMRLLRMHEVSRRGRT
jgi:hypothetical protein